MKTTKIIYWITTALVAGFMALSAVPNIMVTKESVDFLAHIGYPAYIIPFLGVAKLLGSIAILIPSFRKIKEWAYAGLFFDLAGALYSNVSVDGFSAPLLFIVVLVGVGAVSYVLNDKVNA